MATTPQRWEWTGNDGRQDFSVTIVKDRVEWAAWSRERPDEGGGATQGVEEFLRDGPRAPWEIPPGVEHAVRAYVASGAWREVPHVERADVTEGWNADPDDDRAQRGTRWLSVTVEGRVVKRGEAVDAGAARREVEALLAAGWKPAGEVDFGRQKRWEFERPWVAPEGGAGG